MDDSVFRSWAEQLRVRGRSENSRAMHVELVDLVRGVFPQQAMRFMRLADELRALQQGHPPMVTIRTPYATDDFTQWFGDARNGHQPEFRALLLKWLWAHHRDKAEIYLTRWGIEPPVPVKPESSATSLASTLAILPVAGMNFVYPGEHHHAENAAFSFALTVTVLNNSEPFTILGFRARHIASDG